MPSIRVGQPTYTSDGRCLGEVKEVAETQFKVNAHLRPDYWLGRNRISLIQADHVAVAFVAERIDEFIAEQRPTMTGNR